MKNIRGVLRSRAARITTNKQQKKRKKTKYKKELKRIILIKIILQSKGEETATYTHTHMVHTHKASNESQLYRSWTRLTDSKLCVRKIIARTVNKKRRRKCFEAKNSIN